MTMTTYLGFTSVFSGSKRCKPIADISFDSKMVYENTIILVNNSIIQQ